MQRFFFGVATRDLVGQDQLLDVISIFVRKDCLSYGLMSNFCALQVGWLVEGPANDILVIAVVAST